MIQKKVTSRRNYNEKRFKSQIMNQIENIIYTALNLTDNNELRAQAEANIFQLANENHTAFFLTLSNIIGDEQKAPHARQSAATVFKRLLTITDEHNTYYWDRVTINAKLNIKEQLLSTLISADVIIIRAGANAIAQIASIEIPRNEWLDIVDTLAENTRHEDYNIRRASVITLGFICQELKNMKSTIDDESSKQILGSLLIGLNKEGEIVELSTAAIRDSIPFLRNILQNVQYCNKTFEFLMPLMNNSQVRSKVYEIMFEFCKHCYPLVHNYLNIIIKFTVNHMQLRNDDSLLALTLWDTIATEYLERSTDIKERVNQHHHPTLHNYVMMASQDIIPEIMALMLILNKNDSDFAELREGAVQTLTVVVECGDHSVVDKVTEGVTTVLRSSNAGQRQATVLLFSCLINYQDRYQIEIKLKNGFAFFYKLLQDSEVIVVANTLNGFLTLSEYFPKVWMTNPEIKEIFHHLLTMAKNQNQNIKVLSLGILANITEVLNEHPEPIATEPKEYIKDLVGMFLEALSKGLHKDAVEKIIVVIMNIIINTTNIPIANELIEHLIGQYHHFSRSNAQDKNIIVEQLLSVVHTCLLAIAKSSLPKPQLKDQIFNLIDEHIRCYGVESQGINMISAASACYKKEFKNKIEQYWDYIMHALALVDQKPIFRNTLTCISDIARNHEQFVVDKIMKVFKILVDYMQQNIDRDLKTDILKCFGDLSLGLKKYTEGYIETLLEICENCFEAVYAFSQQESQKAYAQELKESLIEMYHCIVFSVNDQSHCNSKMASHFPLICTFIVRSCDVKYKPTVQYLKNCLYLIFDCSLFYANNMQFKPDVFRITESKEVTNLIDTIRKYQDKPEVKDLILFIEDKLRMRR